LIVHPLPGEVKIEKSQNDLALFPPFFGMGAVGGEIFSKLFTIAKSGARRMAGCPPVWISRDLWTSGSTCPQFTSLKNPLSGLMTWGISPT
jgi:hypothetical protein